MFLVNWFTGPQISLMKNITLPSADRPTLLARPHRTAISRCRPVISVSTHWSSFAFIRPACRFRQGHIHGISCALLALSCSLWPWSSGRLSTRDRTAAAACPHRVRSRNFMHVRASNPVWIGALWKTSASRRLGNEYLKALKSIEIW